MLGEPFDAATAQRYGIVNGVCPDTETLERARDAAARLATKPRRRCVRPRICCAWIRGSGCASAWPLKASVSASG